ncbi:MAG: right-handed parallel beta-helix repeat-containing protein, partial [Candidatus Zixiibacteriota bacterium]
GISSLSVPTLTPEIYWTFVGYPETEQVQFEIEVGTDNDWSAAELWATGPVSSDISSAIYDGLPLTDRGVYYIRVRVSDGVTWGSWKNEMFIIHTTIITVHVPLDFASIQEGIDYALNGDTVQVAPGTYEELINFNGKLIVVKSSDGPLETIITGDSAMYSALVTFNHGETRDAVLEGFTLLEGWLGVYCEGSGPTIKRNLLNGQHTTEWAAIDLAAPGYPPSARLGPAGALIINNTIVNCANGGISSFSNEEPVIINNIIAFNTGYGIHLQEDYLPAVLSHNDVYGNIADYINVGPDSGSISDDPLFNPDFTLAPNSPCIDTGDPDPQYNDPDNSRSDMGALPIVNNYPFASNFNFGIGVNPNAIPTFTPEFFWTYTDMEETMQQQYEIEVGTDEDWSIAEMWASGPVISGDTNIVYSGTTLEERVQYFVRIRVNNGEAWGGWNMKKFKVKTTFLTFLVPDDYTTIQGAIDASDDGDTVLVAPGIYDGLINFSGKLIAVRSSGGPSVTVITGSDSIYSALVTFNNGETQAALLEGFTLLEGWLGIYCENAGPTIRYNVLRDQHTTEWAAINLAGPGYPPSAGFGPAPAVIVNNTIVNCTNGGISSFSTSAPIIKNNIVAFNGGYGIHLQDSLLPAELSYNDVYGNPFDYINTFAGLGSINEDPLFDESLNLTAGSPCIDAGDPDPIYNDPDGTRNDMGALAVGGFVPGDANSDDAVNLLDAVFIIRYLYKGGVEPNPPARADANADTAINLLDVVLLVNYLYREGPPPTGTR